MNLQPLFELQDVLDKKINEEKGLEGRYLLPEKILALQVELAECANEWRGFKFWSENQEPRIKIPVYQECIVCLGAGYIVHDNGIVTEDCVPCKAEGRFHIGYESPLLEEYVDCLHFILSIGLEINKTNPINAITMHSIHEDASTDKDFIVGTFSQIFKYTWNVHVDYTLLFAEFLKLGISLNFTWDQIVQAYYKKNQINHKRQKNGY